MQLKSLANAAEWSRQVVALVFGGRSAEHEVSLRSAQAIHGALLELGCAVHCIGIDRAGIWRYQGVPASFPGFVDQSAPAVSISLGHQVISYDDGGPSGLRKIELDVLYPALHGPWGEDGTIQGLAAMSNLPCVGSGTLGSAIAMDKDIAKRLLSADKISVAPWLSCSRTMPPWSEVVAELGNSVFVKPASLGSSIGVRHVTDAKEYARAFEEAKRFDDKVLLETKISGREIECGVLEIGDRLIASELGEIIPLGDHEYYDYVAKYDDENGARLCVPADLVAEVKAQIQEISRRAFRCLGLRTLARIDFFLTADDGIILNEVNTLPGFTSISMYPKMFECSGYPLTKLVSEILKATVEPKVG